LIFNYCSNLKVKIIVVVFENDRKFDSVSNVSKPHLTSGQVGVEDPVQQEDPVRVKTLED
jgi:hypothetical protein